MNAPHKVNASFRSSPRNYIITPSSQKTEGFPKQHNRQLQPYKRSSSSGQFFFVRQTL